MSEIFGPKAKVVLKLKNDCEPGSYAHFRTTG